MSGSVFFGHNTDWQIVATDEPHLTRRLNGWRLNVLKINDAWRALGLAPNHETGFEDDIEGLSNALIIAEGFATDPEPPPPGVRDRLLKRVAEELVPESAA